MPVWAAANPKGAPPRIYGRMSWGDLMQIHVLDGRQYRDIPPCGWGEAQACEAAYDPAISMLGRRQENWLYDGLRRSDARWTVLGSNVMMARLDHDGDLGDLLWNDAWDGFPEARNRLSRQIVQAGVRNPMVLSGDWHSTFVNDIRKDFDKPGSPVIATEFVGTSISSNGDTPIYGPYYGPYYVDPYWNPAWIYLYRSPRYHHHDAHHDAVAIRPEARVEPVIVPVAERPQPRAWDERPAGPRREAGARSSRGTRRGPFSGGGLD